MAKVGTMFRISQQGRARWSDGVVGSGPFEQTDDVMVLSAELVDVLTKENSYLRAADNTARLIALARNPGLADSGGIDPRISGMELLSQQARLMSGITHDDQDHLNRYQRIKEISHRLTRVHPRQISQIVGMHLAKQGDEGQKMLAELRDFSERWNDYQIASRLSPNDLREALINDTDIRLSAETRARMTEKWALSPDQIAWRVADIFQSVIFGVSNLPSLWSGDDSSGLSAAVDTMRDAGLYMLRFASREIGFTGPTQTITDSLP